MISNEPEYRKRINSRVTVYLSDKDNHLVGCKVKGIRRVVDDIKWFDTHITDGKVKLSFLFVSLHGAFDDDEDARKFYRTLSDFVRKDMSELNVSPVLT
ncbi:MAG: hypothetical protein KDA68_10315 [Planctomycetaceae bacterium]|nr:hypothetical protein [Planctomycetaceae bacterium]